MIERNTVGEFVAECDHCPEILETDERDFHNAVREMKNKGWVIKKIGNNFDHTCPSCAEDEASAMFNEED